MIYEQYVNLGISVIPVQPGTKQPHFEKLNQVGWVQNGNAVWQPAMKEIATPEVLDSWFGDESAGIALVAGKVSNNLVYLDWDNAASYVEWATAHKDIVNRTPVSKTAKGYHVFFRTMETTSGGHLYYNDAHAGDIRGDGMYVLAPPSLHPSGIRYRWLRHPSDGIVEIDNLASIGITVPTTSSTTIEFEVQPVGISDEVILLRASSAWWCKDYFPKLWKGDWTSVRADNGKGRYPSQSEADLALCRVLAYWTGRDVGRIHAMFRRSGLMRPKWDEMRGELTYGQNTVNIACASTTAVHEVTRRHQNKFRSI